MFSLGTFPPTIVLHLGSECDFFGPANKGPVILICVFSEHYFKGGITRALVLITLNFIYISAVLWKEYIRDMTLINMFESIVTLRLRYTAY